MNWDQFDEEGFYIRSGSLTSFSRLFILIVTVPLFAVGLVGLNNIVVDLLIEPLPDLKTQNLIFGFLITSVFLFLPLVGIYLALHIESVLFLKPKVRQAILFKKFIFKNVSSQL